MTKEQFKKTIHSTALKNGFDKSFGGWFKSSSECIIVLNLQRSNFSELFYLNIKIFVQGVFGIKYIPSKDLVNNDMGNMFRRPPNRFSDYLKFGEEVNSVEMNSFIEKMFTDFVIPFTNSALTKTGIKELYQKGEIAIPPVVVKELEMLSW